MDFTEQWSDTCSRVGHAARTGNLDSLLKCINLQKPVDVSDNRGWKPLHEAAALGPSLECLEELLKHKDTNINWKTHEGETALLLACKRRRGSDASNVVSLLLKYGANPNVVDNEEESPLLAALRNDSKEVVELLLQSGADVNATDCSLWSPLHEAANRKDANLLCSLLSRGAHIDVQDECGMTPIFTAAQYGRENCLRELLKAAKERGQKDVVNIGAEDWATPLMIAAQQGFADCVALLAEYGANPDLKTSDHATALHMAVQGNHKLCLDILLSKMDVTALISYFHPSTPRTWVHSDMICPLHLAVEWESHDCLKALLDAGFSPDSLNRCELPGFPNLPYVPDRETSLSFAILKRNEIAIAILLKAGASCNPPALNTYHPLLRAISNPTLQEFHILLESGSDVNYKRHICLTNEVFLHCLLTSGRFLRPLLYHGCDPRPCFQGDREPFLNCSVRYLRRERVALRDYMCLLLRVLVIDGAVQVAFHALASAAAEDVKDVMKEIDSPSSLKQVCSSKIRQHLYGIHGVRFPKLISGLCLPSVLEEYVGCRDLLTS